MKHEGWDLADKRWIRLDYIQLISGDVLIRVQPLEKMPLVARLGSYGQFVFVDELRVGLLASGSLRILTRRAEEGWEASVYSGTYWYGLYTGSVEKPDEESDKTS